MSDIRKYLLALLLLCPADVRAQGSTVYGPDGRVQARTHTGSNGTVTVYGADGRVQQRVTPHPNGNVTIYGPNGRVQGTITPNRGR